MLAGVGAGKVGCFPSPRDVGGSCFPWKLGITAPGSGVCVWVLTPWEPRFKGHSWILPPAAWTKGTSPPPFPPGPDHPSISVRVQATAVHTHFTHAWLPCWPAAGTDSSADGGLDVRDEGLGWQGGDSVIHQPPAPLQPPPRSPPVRVCEEGGGGGVIRGGGANATFFAHNHYNAWPLTFTSILRPYVRHILRWVNCVPSHRLQLCINTTILFHVCFG